MKFKTEHPHMTSTILELKTHFHFSYLNNLFNKSFDIYLANKYFHTHYQQKLHFLNGH